MIGSNNTDKFKIFQIRWAEKLGYNDNPYLIRWTFIFFGYSMRIHHWIKSDDNRYFHDHSSDLLSIVLKGKYTNVKPLMWKKNLPPTHLFEVELPPESSIKRKFISNTVEYPVEGIFNSWKNFFNMKKSIWFSKATEQHYLSIPKKGAWTLLFEGKAYHKWGFYVNQHKWRPLRYFSKFGIIQTENYQ